MIIRIAIATDDQIRDFIEHPDGLQEFLAPNDIELRDWPNNEQFLKRVAPFFFFHGTSGCADVTFSDDALGVHAIYSETTKVLVDRLAECSGYPMSSPEAYAGLSEIAEYARQAARQGKGLIFKYRFGMSDY
jgi:hypothetical protein